MIIRQVCRQQARALFGSSRRSVGLQSRLFSNEAGSTITTQYATPVDTPQAPAPVPRTPEEKEALAAQETWQNINLRRKQFNRLGSYVRRGYQPEDLIANPPRPEDVTLELLLAAQSHLGHSTSLWNPANSGYIYGIRHGVHIISLEITAAYLRRAAKVVEEVARRGGLILFVGTRKGQKRIVVRAAELAGGYFIFERWVPGSLTNGQQILGHCELKMVDALDNEVPGYEHMLTDRAVLKPDLVICLNPMENAVLLHECGLLSVPTIGIIDTDADATRVTYPIPANDDSLRCVATIAGVLGRAGEAGQKKRLEQSRKGDLPYEPIKYYPKEQ
ncbi:hypothetical protein VTO42DRAFT_3171 [Malbranchea cinnamomea]